MTKQDSTQSNTVPLTGKTWDSDTTEFFRSRTGEIKAVLHVLLSNITDFSDVRASDSNISLALQNILSSAQEIETFSYALDLDRHIDIGSLSVHLMRARALTEILENMIFQSCDELTIAEDDLYNYLKAIERLIVQADVEISASHQRHLKKAA
jgi:hypothetical protein